MDNIQRKTNVNPWKSTRDVSHWFDNITKTNPVAAPSYSTSWISFPQFREKKPLLKSLPIRPIISQNKHEGEIDIGLILHAQAHDPLQRQHSHTGKRKTPNTLRRHHGKLRWRRLLRTVGSLRIIHPLKQILYRRKNICLGDHGLDIFIVPRKK